jgi:non-ribosomal peptide synthase protein (TIGR01720 family)
VRKSPKDIETYINKHAVTFTSLTPKIIQELDPVALPSLRFLESGGEAGSLCELKKWIQHCQVVNAYGMTETTLNASLANIDPETESLSIGRPISNTQIYIINGDVLCGIGVPGELCIAGEGLARGYLNQPELTAERFVANPYGEGRLYRSGDLARWLPSGNIEYLGRIDEQVKIRGFRIELGEIKRAIRELEEIKDCAVISREEESGEKAIYAYLVSDREISVSWVRDMLVKSLPDYMIPAYMTQIESIPITRNGKLDKRALPEIEVRTETEYVAPRNEMEEQLCAIFEEILGVRQVGIKDSFFALGGDSIKAMRVVSKMREVGCDLNVKDIMSGLIIEEISERTKTARELIYEQSEVRGEVRATPIMEAFERWGLEEPHHFNQAMMVKVEAAAAEVEEAIKALVSHHDMLRAVYAEGRLSILGNEEKCYDYEVCDCRGESDEEEKIEQECDEKQRSINLEKGPLFKCVLFQVEEGSHLFMCLHHLVVDGVSWRILIEDLQSGLKQLKEGKEIKLPKKTASFKEWSEVLREYKESKKLNKEEAYWKSIQEKMKEGRYKGKAKGEESGYATISMKLDEEETRKLLKESREAYTTEINDLLLSALGMAIKEVKGQDKITVRLEGHGREKLHKPIKVDRTVGWFTSMYPVILECFEEVEESIIQTKEMLRKVPNHGIGYGLLSGRIEESDISFSYLGEIEEGKEARKSYRTGRSVSEKNQLLGGIVMNGIIQDKQLMFSLTYERSKYSEKEMSELIKVYKERLLKEIFHCINKEEVIKTPSDFTGNDVTTSVLSILDDILEGSS